MRQLGDRRRRSSRWLPLGLIVSGLLAAPLGAAAQPTRLSVDSAGNQADGASEDAFSDRKGQLVVFRSVATDLVAGDTNGEADAFARDTKTGLTMRVSVDSAGNEGDDASFAPHIDEKGDLIVFESDATNLVPGDTNGGRDIFSHDPRTGATVRVSLDSAGGEADDDSFAARTNGKQVVFHSEATNLVAGDTNGVSDIFLRDLKSGVTTRLSVSSAGAEADDESEAPDLDSKARWVVFESDATNLVPGDTNGVPDVFVRDLKAGTTLRVSVSSAGAEGDGRSANAFTNGKLVVFESDATNLVSGDTNGERDVFVHEVATGITTRASVDSSGAEADGPSQHGFVDRKGRTIVFASDATNLVPADTNDRRDVFVRDLKTGTTTRVNLDAGGNQGDANSENPRTNGKLVIFESTATNLVPGDTNAARDVFVVPLE